MSEESTTPDLAERWRRTDEAFLRRDFDAIMSFFAPDAVWDLSSGRIGKFEGPDAIRRFHEDWMGSFVDDENQVEAWDLGNDVSFGNLGFLRRGTGTSLRVNGALKLGADRERGDQSTPTG